MRKRVLTVFLTTIAAIACAIGLIACGESYNNNDSKRTDGNISTSAYGSEASVVLGTAPELTCDTLLDAFARARNSAESTSTIRLLRDVEVSANLPFGSYKNITLDLNGYALTAIDQLVTADAIFNMSTCNFTLEDSRPTYTPPSYETPQDTPNSHEITVDGKTVLIKGGLIRGGQRGFRLGYDGKLTMNGGTICSNTSNDGYAAGVFVNGGEFTMNKGAIMYNSNPSGSYGSGVSVVNSRFIMTGGTISNNSMASGDGAGVWINGQSGFLNLEGDAVVTDNISGSSESNVYLSNSYNKIYFTGAMKDGAKIGISNNYTFTSNYKSTNADTNPRKYFFADNTTKAIGLNSSGEAEVVNAVATVTTGGVTTNYPDINSAFTDANGKTATVELLTNVTASSSLNINNSSSNVTFNLAGYTLTLGSGNRISLSNGTLTLKDTAGDGKITGGSAVNGGGVYVSSATFIMESGEISGNTATKDDGDSKRETGNGGGVYIDGGKFVMKSGTISENLASSGGGVYMNGGTFTMENGTISGNKVGEYGNCDGVYVNGGAFEMSGGAISGNGSGNSESGYGGGVCVTGESATFKMTGDATISNNKTYNGYGGVSVSGGAKFTMEGGTISGNKADGGSFGGVGVNGVNTIFEMYDGAVISGNRGMDSGGVRVGGGTVTMFGGEIKGNSSRENGGGVYVSGGTFTMKNGTISGNFASDSYYNLGGGVYVSGGTFTMKNGTISGNRAGLIDNGSKSDGGGVYVRGGEFEMSGGAIVENKVVGGNGGGVYVKGGTFTVSGEVDISNNDFLDVKYSNVITGTTPNNVYLASGKIINIAGTLTDAQIGVMCEGDTGTVTSGYTTHNGSDNPNNYFFSDDDNYFVVPNDDGEVEIVTAIASVITKVGGNDSEENFGIFAEAWSVATGYAGEGKEVTLKLLADVPNNTSRFTLNCGSGKKLTLDLNGKAFTSSADKAFVINSGELIVDDTSADNKGAIEATAGEALYLQDSGCKCTVSGGTIVASGIAIEAQAQATVVVEEGATIQASDKNFGAIMLSNANVIMTGGKITGNVNSAGVFVSANGQAATVTLSGGEISGNKYGVSSFGGTINVSGNPKVKDNTDHNIAQGVNVVNPLTSGAEIYFDIEGTVTSGYNTNNGSTDPNTYFKTNKTGKIVYLNKMGEVVVGDGVAKVTATGVSQGFGTFEAAVAYINDNATSSTNIMTLTLLAPIEVSSTVTFKASAKTNPYIYFTLDLNGYVLKMTGTGGVMSITKANFLLTDSRQNNENNRDGGTFTYNGNAYKGGVITGGNATNGGAISTSTNSTIALSSGKIIGNTASNNGGAIYSQSGGSGGGIYISGTVLIAYNSANKHGGGIYSYGNFTMTGGKIVNNTAETDGGAVYLNKLAKFTMSGGEISGNTGGYAVRTQGQNNQNTQITLSGNPIIRDNPTGNIGLIILAESNSSPAFITVGKLNNGADIHVVSEAYTKDNAKNDLTIGYGANNTDVNGIVSPGRYFTYDAPGKSVLLNSDGEVIVGEPIVELTVGDGDPTYFGTIDDAFAKANAATTSATVLAVIKPLANVTAYATLPVNSGNHIKLDLNGKNVTGNGKSNVIKVSGFFYLDGAGEISYGGNGKTDFGSGVYIESGMFKMYDGTITGNVASQGAGVFVGASSRFEMHGGTISGNRTAGNSVYGEGAGVYVRQNSTVVLKGGTISDNEALTKGGGIFLSGDAHLELSGNPVISGNKATVGENQVDQNVYLDNTFGDKALITVTEKLNLTNKIGITLRLGIGKFTSGYGANNTVDGNIVDPNNYFKPDDSGYMVYLDGSDAYLGERTATVTDKDGNVVEYASFALAWQAALDLGNTEDDMATVTLMKDVELSASANVPVGKFIKLDLNGHVLKMTGEGSVITVSGHLTIDDSNTDNLSHGVVSQADGSTLTISGGVITGGTASGISLAQNSGAVVNLVGGAIAGNTAANGGGVSIMDGCTFNMNGGKVIGNKATNSGGGVYSTHGTFNLNDGEVEGNSAVMNAGGVSATNSTEFYMTGGKIINNTVPTNQAERSGGGVYINGTTTITGGEISGNSANWCGGGIFLEGGFLYLYGGVIENNTATHGGGIYYFGGQLRVKGNPIVSGNNATISTTNNASNNISVVVWDRRIYIDGVMGESASLGITLCGDSGTGNGIGLFTSGYASNNTVGGNVSDPYDYFFSDGGYSVALNGDEAGIYYVFTVNFYDEDGTLLDGPKKVIKDEKVTFAGTLPTKESTVQYSYTYCWYERVDGNDTLYNIETTPVTRNLELYGKFVAKTREYVVTVDEVNETGRLNGSTQRTVEYGTKLTVDGYSLKVEKTGKTYSAFTANITDLYDFVGWEIGGEIRADGYEHTVTDDVTVKLVVRINVNVVWTYDNTSVETTVYNGVCDKGYIKAVFTYKDGTAIVGMEYDGFSDEIDMVASNGKNDLQEVGTYTFSVKDLAKFEKYVFLNGSNEFEFEITPYLIDLSNDDYYHWTLAGYDSALRNGKVYVYEVDGEMLYYFEERSDLGTAVEVKDVVRSIVRYRGEGKTHTININDDEMAPLFADETKDRSSVVYSGVCSATELGRYNAVATLTLNDKLNYKYVCGTIDPKREMSIDLSDNGTTAVIKKAWYVATISNALLLPDRSDEYSLSDFTYGDNSFAVPVPVLEHGMLTDSNAQFTLTKNENGNKIIIGTFVYSKLGEYINKSMPAGDYILDISVDSVPDEGGISHEAFENSYNFTVEKADITPYITTDNAKGNSYEYEYTGELKLHDDDDLTVALPYAASADRIGVWQNAEYDKYYAAVVGYSMSRWSNRSYRTLEQLNSQITVAQKPVNVGEYKIYYRVTANNFTTYGGDISKGDDAEYYYTVVIEKSDYDTDDWGFEKDKYEFEYDGESHSVVVKNVPEGVKVTYTVTDKDGNIVPNDAVINVGEYTVTATFIGDDNHNPIPTDFTCSTVLEILPKDIDMSEVLFNDKTVVYNGSAFGVDQITGLPDGVTVVYSENSFTDAGKYKVVATVSANGNFNLIGDTELSAYLYILATDITVYVGDTDEVLVNAHSDKGFAYGTELKAEIVDDYTSEHITDDILSAIRIKLVNGGEAIAPSGEITLRVLIPEELRGKSLNIVFVNGDATAELTYTVDGNYAVITTQAFGEFVFVEKVEVPVPPDGSESNNEDGKSFWKSYWWLWLLLLLLLILIIILIIIFKRRKDDEEKETAAVVPLAAPSVEPMHRATEELTATQDEEEQESEESATPEETDVAAEESKIQSEPDEEALKQAAEEEARKQAEAEAKKKERAEKAKAAREARAAKAKAEREAAEAAALAAAEEEARKQAEAEAKKKERAEKAKAAREARAAKIKEEQKAQAAAVAAMSEEERAAAAAEEAKKRAEAEAKKKERAEKVKATRAANAEKAKAEREAAEAAAKAAAEEEARKQADAEAKKKERAAKAKAAREARAAAMAAERERIAAEEAKKLLADEQAAALIQEIEEPSDRSRQCIINIDMLSRYFENGETVTLKELQKRVPKFDRRATYLKVLARGTLDKKLTVVADSFSLDAVKMIALTGGNAVRKGKK